MKKNGTSLEARAHYKLSKAKMSKEKLSGLITFVDRFRWAIDEIQQREGLNQKAVALRLGVHSASLSQLKSGASKKPSKATLLLLRQVFCLNPGWLESGRGEPFLEPEEQAILEGFVEVPRYGFPEDAAAPFGLDRLQAPLNFRADWLQNKLQCKPGDLALIEMNGQEMTPTIMDGDVILVDRSKSYIQNERIYVIQVAGSLLVRRLRQNLDGTIEAYGDHSQTKSERLTPEQQEGVKIFGQVLWRGGEL